MRTRVLLAIALALAIAQPAAASLAGQQTTYTVGITSISPEAFPAVTATVAVSDAKGVRVPGLNKTAFTLLENNIPVSLTQLSEDELGLQLGIVIEAGNVFSKRDADLTTRLDHVKNALIDFAVGGNNPPHMKDQLDNINIFVPEGPLLQNSSVGGEMRNALLGYASEFRFETGLFGLIGQALDAVSSAPPRLGMRREVVVFTSGIDASADAEISALAARANAAGVTIHTVLVGPPAAVNLPLAKNVKALADLAGGSYRYFDKPDSLSPLWEIVVSQRVQYLLTYRSGLRQSGQHTLQALANVSGASLLSPPAEFSLTLQPPVVSLVDAPATITRATDERGADPAGIEPRSQQLAVKVEFPDGHPRRIAKLQLLADLTIADERTNGNFDSLTWDLTGYGQTGPHALQVYVQDELGLDARTDVTNVVVEVSIPPPITTQYAPVFTVALGISVIAIAVAALVVAAAVLRRRPTVITNIVRESGGRMKEPTEPFIPTPHRGDAKNKQGKAYLERVDESVPGPHPTIELVGDNLRLGRDETLAQIAIQDKSVSRLHARITEEAEGLFFIHDEGSTSGTWVNFKQVSMSGQQLREGDLINLGRVQLRFSLRNTLAALAGPANPLAQSASVAQADEDSTGAFEPLPASPTHERTDPGLKPSANREPDGDEFHTEAFSPPFDDNRSKGKGRK